MINGLDERLRVMRDLDIESARQFFPELTPGTLMPPTDEVILISLHKSRYESVQIEPRLRFESYWFLKSRQLSRIGGAPLLPNGELPE